MPSISADFTVKLRYKSKTFKLLETLHTPVDMAERDCAIYLSKGERERLQEVASEAFGTDSVANGAVVSYLMNNFDSEEN